MAKEYVMSRALSGHMYYGSPYEGFSDCGTCDGARCYRCKEKWWVEGVNSDELHVFDNKEEAENFINSKELAE